MPPRARVCVCVCKPSGITLLFGFDFIFASDEIIIHELIPCISIPKPPAL